MATLQPSATADDEDFTDEDLAAEMETFVTKLDADYETAFGPIKAELEAKGPPEDGHDQPTMPGPPEEGGGEEDLSEVGETAVRSEDDPKAEPDPSAPLKSATDDPAEENSSSVSS